ncbi:twin-arginine translocase subunit TatC [Dyadobacter fanqingshengii]|uniref:Sec-independent protein translocase protein TatC n=1 Tax=Dyadobacter fanqingshengii TaxID=2906443 RepID=A0A9X1PHR8_9BACT|nr:twin-arginine translocase subunit TatC [Dyadobacter fanqingshengii]MCF0043557.1 twin-arginine translocase subunit TatC [Dyadobacter fanqingshengii]MCF2504094.1 twin-arginine translocase subunit TatC [Dyadobacter fanqingshengii]USJ34824.1 twin-arginine translocase subunit TatC [Dyadobacter fanqingshengii]
MPLDQELESEEEEVGKEMSFIGHLEELRWHVIRAGGSILVFAILAFVYIKEIYHYVIIAPSQPDFWTYRMLCQLADKVQYDDLCIKALNFKLQAIGVGDQFTMSMTSSVIAGLVFAFPYAFWEVWRFIKPGLKPSERKSARGAVFYVTFLFFSGVFFGYYIVTPLAINFLANFTLDPSIINEFSLSSYISLVATLTLACGIAFQLPIVVYVLAKVGVLTPAFMREYRKHAMIVILIVAAVITPSPDIYSQVIVAIPLFLLYELSILVAGKVEREKIAEEKALANSSGGSDI